MIIDMADTYLRERVQTGRPAPLRWHPMEVRVLVTDTTARPAVAHEIEVRGMVSSHFGIFRGDGHGVGEPGCSCYSLVHRPSRRIIVTLPYRQACKAVAAEPAPCCGGSPPPFLRGIDQAVRPYVFEPSSGEGRLEAGDPLRFDLLAFLSSADVVECYRK